MKNFSTIVKTVLLSAFLFVGNALMAQITVSGTVIDGGLNEPIIGASVLEVGTTLVRLPILMVILSSRWLRAQHCSSAM